MNYLTNIKNTQRATRREIDAGIAGDRGSWHARFAHSAFIFVGGLPFELTEGDLLAVFSQYGEIVDMHLVRDEKTGKSRGFAFMAYEDQRSTVLAVDNLNGARVGGRIVRVEHVDNYRKKRAEIEGREEGGERKQEAIGKHGVERTGTERGREDVAQPPLPPGIEGRQRIGRGGEEEGRPIVADIEANGGLGDGGSKLSVAGVMDEARRRGMTSAWQSLLQSRGGSHLDEMDGKTDARGRDRHRGDREKDEKGRRRASDDAEGTRRRIERRRHSEGDERSEKVDRKERRKKERRRSKRRDRSLSREKED